MSRKIRTYLIAVGLIAAVLSQYAWLFPVPYAYLTCAGVAMVCALVAGLSMLVDR